jgi:hypothetical protein
MRWKAAIVLAAILAAVVGMRLGSSPSRMNANGSGAVEASTGTILPGELHLKAGKDLPDETVREPF